MSDPIREAGGRLVVDLAGEIDLDRAPQVRRLLLESVAKGRDLLVDLSRVSYIDSSGIASLVEALQTAGKHGTGFGLVSVNPAALRVFELARLDKVFVIHPDLDSALAAAD